MIPCDLKHRFNGFLKIVLCLFLVLCQIKTCEEFLQISGVEVIDFYSLPNFQFIQRSIIFNILKIS